MVPIDHFDTAAELYARRVAIIDGGVVLSFAELRDLTLDIALVLQATIPAGEPFAAAVYSPNDYRALAAMIGIMRAGGTIVPTHAHSDAATNARFLNIVGPRVLLYHSDMAAPAHALADAVPSIEVCLCLDAAFEPTTRRSPAGRGGWDVWIDASGNRSRPVFFWPTSGSTGEPKAVVDEVATFDATLKTMRAVHASASAQTCLVVAPLSHAAGPHAFEMLTLGATVCIQRHFDVGNVLQAIEVHRVTDLWLPPTALHLLVSAPGRGRYDLSSLRHLQLGAAAISPARLGDAVAALGPCISHTYGQIESGPLTVLDRETIAAAAAGTGSERLRSSGRPTFLNRIAIMSEDGRVLPPGTSGEIVARGASIKAYLDPAQTREARRFGWHHTGDLGQIDESGFLFVVGRTRDVINGAGIKTPAAAIEAIILEIAGVMECAVVAVADEVRGEVAKAVVTLRPDVPTTTVAIMDHCRGRLGVATAPVAVEVWAEMPRSGAGKIDKRTIRAAVEAR